MIMLIISALIGLLSIGYFRYVLKENTDLKKYLLNAEWTNGYIHVDNPRFVKSIKRIDDTTGWGEPLWVHYNVDGSCDLHC